MCGRRAGRDVRERFGPIMRFLLSQFDGFDDKLQCTDLDRELPQQKAASLSAAKDGPSSGT